MEGTARFAALRHATRWTHQSHRRIRWLVCLVLARRVARLIARHGPPHRARRAARLIVTSREWRDLKFAEKHPGRPVTCHLSKSVLIDVRGCSLRSQHASIVHHIRPTCVRAVSHSLRLHLQRGAQTRPGAFAHRAYASHVPIVDHDRLGEGARRGKGVYHLLVDYPRRRRRRVFHPLHRRVPTRGREEGSVGARAYAREAGGGERAMWR